MIQRTSYVEARAAVTFPAFAAERHYMIPFHQKTGLPSELKHWQKTVDAMLDNIQTDSEIYLMIDQKVVYAGEAHRRPGIHVDGYWNPSKLRHVHSANPMLFGVHTGEPSEDSEDTHRIRLEDGTFVDDWSNATLSAPEAIILATDVTSAIAYKGKWSGIVGHMGDCSHLDVSHMKPIILSAGTVFAGNAAMLHESAPVPFTCQRTVVRLNVPGWSPELH